MEKMPFRPDLEVSLEPSEAHGATATHWRRGLPFLNGSMGRLREPEIADAPSLYALLNTEDVARFISPPPATPAGFERFIAWMHAQRAAGEYICFAVVPAGCDAAVGVFQVRQNEPGFGGAEWGFAVGSTFWGTGLFLQSARLVIDFTFDVVGARRLEARAATRNGRGNGALRKLGAVQEGVLRRSLLRDGEYLDQVLWSILADDWRQAKAVREDGPE